MPLAIRLIHCDRIGQVEQRLGLNYSSEPSHLHVNLGVSLEAPSGFPLDGAFRRNSLQKPPLRSVVVVSTL